MRKILYLLENALNFNFRNRNEATVNAAENELIHPRFGMKSKDIKANKKIINTHLFLMYSKENEAFFI